MHCLNSIGDLGSLGAPIHLAIGVFDGVHLGHRAVIGSAIQHAAEEGGASVVATFNPHPAEVLAPSRAPRLLTCPAHQELLIARLGAEAVLAIPFDARLAEQEPGEFIRSLQDACDLASVHVGLDWTFGKDRRGNLDSLRALGVARGFAVRGIPPVRHAGKRISSSAIRRAVENGDLDLAAHLLERPLALYGTVQQGDRLGRKLGFPTANLLLENEALPPYGVYIVRLPGLEGRHGVANLGVRPTLGGGRELRFEVHVLGWEGNLYGRPLEVEILHPLRAERSFKDLDALREQIARDVEDAGNWLAETSQARTRPI